MVVQKTVCWPNLGCVLRRAVCRCRSRIHCSEAGTGSSCSAMTQHYPTTSAAAAPWAFTQSHTPYYLPEHYVKRCCVYCACCRRETKSVVEVLDDSATCSRVMTTVWLMYPNDHSNSRKYCRRIDTVMTCV